MERQRIVLRIGGVAWKVQVNAPEEQMQRLAQQVDAKLRQLAPHQTSNPQAYLLVALAFAHEAEEERTRRHQLRDQTRTFLRNLLRKVEGVLEKE